MASAQFKNSKNKTKITLTLSEVGWSCLVSLSKEVIGYNLLIMKNVFVDAHALLTLKHHSF